MEFVLVKSSTECIMGSKMKQIQAFKLKYCSARMASGAWVGFSIEEKQT